MTIREMQIDEIKTNMPFIKTIIRKGKAANKGRFSHSINKGICMLENWIDKNKTKDASEIDYERFCWACRYSGDVAHWLWLAEHHDEAKEKE